MTTSTDNPKAIHQGKNLKRFREMMGLKQEVLAERPGVHFNSHSMMRFCLHRIQCNDHLPDRTKMISHVRQYR